MESVSGAADATRSAKLAQPQDKKSPESNEEKVDASTPKSRDLEDTGKAVDVEA